MKIFSFSPFGYEGSLVSVEVDLRRGIPAIDLVGLADGAVKESRERMRSAIRNSGLDFPPERVLISLSPADLKKEGAGFDLAIALAVLSAKKMSEENDNEKSDDNSTDLGDEKNSRPQKEMVQESILVMGELELNGKVRPVRGIHAAVSTAKSCGISLCIVPKGNVEEAMEILGMKVFGADNLKDAFFAMDNPEKFLQGNLFDHENLSNLPEGSVEIDGVFFPPEEEDFNFNQIKNQDYLLRGLQIAAAGGHNILAFGAPGCGKTLSLQHFGNLQPLLTMEEAIPVTRIYSIAGLLQPGIPLQRKAPFRQPHQTATIEGMCGGGYHCSPGEISLAHNGALFLDEAAEFKTSVLQMLRVPLESRSVTLSRAGRSTVFPANFQLLLATNPCPCGYFGSKEKICLCSAKSVELYWRKFSGPLLDRIDIRIRVEKKDDSVLAKSTYDLRLGIAKAVSIQRKRQGKKNSILTPGEIFDYCKTTEEAKTILDKTADREQFSQRAIGSCLKLGRTIADMDGKDLIDEESILEAISYRTTELGISAL